MHIKKTELFAPKLFALALGSALMFPTYARAVPQTAPPQAASSPAECVLLGISLNFVFDGTTSANAKNELDSRLYKFNMFLLQNNIDHLETLSMSYKIGQDEDKKMPRLYHLSGTAEYQINSTDGAFKIGQFLTHEKFQTTVSYKPIKPEQCLPEVKPVATAVATAVGTPGAASPGARPVAPPAGAPPAVNAVGGINAVGSVVGDILKQKPPGNQPEEHGNYQNGQYPDMPVLQNAPPQLAPPNR